MAIAIAHLGQSGFRLSLEDAVVYVDPYLSDYVEEIEGTHMRRLRPAPSRPESITDASVVLVSHVHADHCDPLTLGPIARQNPACVFVAPYEVVDLLDAKGIVPRARALVAGDDWLELPGGISVLPVPAAHRDIVRNAHGQAKCVGYAIRAGKHLLYHSGDTSVHPEIVARLRAIGSIDLAMLPVNECNYYRERAGIVGNMSIREAFGLADEIGARTVVPMHFDMFAPNCVFVEEIEAVYRHHRYGFRLKMPDDLTDALP